MRDAKAQAKGHFGVYKGDRLMHQKLIAFISRNYQADDLGQWYFQNGPQRVYVELECTPWIWRVHQADDGYELWSHTGLQASVQEAFEDEQGHLYILSGLGLGRVHSLDMWAGVNMLEHQGQEVQAIAFKEMAVRFNFVLSPMLRQMGKV